MFQGAGKKDKLEEKFVEPNAAYLTPKDLPVQPSISGPAPPHGGEGSWPDGRKCEALDGGIEHDSAGTICANDAWLERPSCQESYGDRICVCSQSSIESGDHPPDNRPFEER